MDTHKTVESVSDAAAIRAVLPRHPVKRLARLLGLPLGTAHEWVYRNLCAARRRELALALIAELDRQDAEERADARRQLIEMAGKSDAQMDHLPVLRAGEVDRLPAGPVLGLGDARSKPSATPAGAQAGEARGAVKR